MNCRIDVKWENENRGVLHVTFSPHWDWDDFNCADQEITRMLSAASGPIDLILDARHVTVPVSTLSMIPMVLKGMRGFTHNSIRLAIVAGNVTYLGIVCSVIRSMYPDETKRLYLVSTLDEALEITRNYVEASDSGRAASAD